MAGRRETIRTAPTSTHLDIWDTGREATVFSSPHANSNSNSNSNATDSTELIKVLSYNTFLVQPAFLFPDSVRRLPLIGKHLTENFSDRDVICLQEVFTKSQFDALRLSIGKVWPHAVGNVGSTGCLQGDSGLFIASRRPISWSRFWNFGSYLVGSDALAGKGILAVETGGGVFLTTHGQADPDNFPTWWFPKRWEKARKSRERCTAFVARIVESVIARSGGAVVVVTGDFNVIGDKEEYANSMVPALSPANLKDAYRSSTADPGFTFDLTENKISTPDGNGPQRLDYIFVLDSVEVSNISVEKMWDDSEGKKNRGLSDHYGLAISVRRKKEQPREEEEGEDK